MNREELKQQLHEKLNISAEKFREVWTEKETQMKQRGLAGNELENHTMRRVALFFRKMKGQATTTLQFIPVGESTPSDFGAKRAHALALEESERDFELAFENGYVNSQGEPVWKTTNWKNGKVIDLNAEMSRTILGMARLIVDGVDPSMSEWKEAHLDIQGRELIERIGVPDTEYMYDIQAGTKKATKEKYNNQKYILFATEETVFDNPQPTPEPFLNMLLSVLGEHKIDATELRTKTREENRDYLEFYMFKADLVRSSDSRNGNSNSVDISTGFMEEEVESGWIAGDIPIMVADEATDVIFVVTSKFYKKEREDKTGKEEVFQLNILNMFPTNPFDLKTQYNTPPVEAGTAIEEKIESVSVPSTPTVTPTPTPTPTPAPAPAPAPAKASTSVVPPVPVSVEPMPVEEKVTVESW